MVWKVRADCTYTTTANKTSRQSAVEALLPSYPTAIAPGYANELGRFGGGVISQSTLRFTVCYDFVDADKDVASAFAAALQTTISAATRAGNFVTIHLARGF